MSFLVLYSNHWNFLVAHRKQPVAPLRIFRVLPDGSWCFMTSQTILFYLWKCRLQPQVCTVHSLNSQLLSFHVWASLHPHLPPKYSQVWSVIVISHCSTTLRVFVLEKVKVLIAWFFVTPWTVAHQVPLSMGFSRQEYWMCCHSLLQGIFLTQGSNLGLLHCKPIFTIWATMGGGVLERPWVITLSLMSSSRTQTPVGSRARLAQGCAEWERWIGFSRCQRWL